MNLETIFVVASLILAIAGVVGANIWALRDPPETKLQRSLSKAIDGMAARTAEWSRPLPGCGVRDNHRTHRQWKHRQHPRAARG
jgi:hypothetical protein